MEDVQKEAQATLAVDESPDKEELRSVEEWAEELGTPIWFLYAARVQYVWPYGRAMTRKEYEQAIASVKLLEVR